MESSIATLKFEITLENHLNIKIEVEVKKGQETETDNIQPPVNGNPHENPLHDEDMGEPNNEEEVVDEVLNEGIEGGEPDDMDVILADEYEDGALSDYDYEEGTFEQEAVNFAIEEEDMEVEDEEPESDSLGVEEENPVENDISEGEMGEDVNAGIINQNGEDPNGMENAILADNNENDLGLEEEDLAEDNGNFAWGEEIFYSEDEGPDPEFEEDGNQRENETSEEDNSSSITDDGEIEEDPEEWVQEEEEDKMEPQIIEIESTDED